MKRKRKERTPWKGGAARACASAFAYVQSLLKRLSFVFVFIQCDLRTGFSKRCQGEAEQFHNGTYESIFQTDKEADRVGGTHLSHVQLATLSS